MSASAAATALCVVATMAQLGAAHPDRLAGGPAANDALNAPPPASAAALAAPGRLVTTGRDASDPFALVAADRIHLYTSQAFGSPLNVPVQSGPTLGRLGPATDALPTLPPWAAAGFTWAPDVHRFGHHYVLYFTAEVAGKWPPEQCIGDAVGTAPARPFTAQPQPLVCQGVLQGSIDPRTFVGAGGTPYLLWKSDENAGPGSAPSGIWSQRLSADGLRLLGTPTEIFRPDERWQGRIVEAPDLVRADGTDWLFYSGGWFNQPTYAIGVARCRGPSGPCTDTSPTPWFASNAQGAGPGEASVLLDGAGAWLLYTPWRSWMPRLGTPPRPVAVACIGFGPAGPYVAASGALPGAAEPPLGTRGGGGGLLARGHHRVGAAEAAAPAGTT